MPGPDYSEVGQARSQRVAKTNEKLAAIAQYYAAHPEAGGSRTAGAYLSSASPGPQPNPGPSPDYSALAQQMSQERAAGVGRSTIPSMPGPQPMPYTDQYQMPGPILRGNPYGLESIPPQSMDEKGLAFLRALRDRGVQAGYPRDMVDNSLRLKALAGK